MYEFFDKIFGGKSETSEQKSFWKKIESEEDLAKAIESSYQHKIAYLSIQQVALSAKQY
jgi:SepF-like predicted cell division protein (DUF552 family)